MAKEHLQLQRGTLTSVIRVFSMYLLVDFSYSVPVPHFELGKILILRDESVLEVEY